MNRALSLLIHGGPGVGKTWLADTAPAPRLVFDAEGGNRFTMSRKIGWNPLMGPPPMYDGTWETCVATVTDFNVMQLGFQWLAQGQHNFRSVVLDSVSEVQQRCIDANVGTNAMRQQDWGELLRQMSRVVRSFRDLTMHPTNPLEAVVLIAMTREKAGRWEPYVQGQLAVTMPYYIDVIGYLFVHQLEDGTPLRRLLVSPNATFEAKDRTGRLGYLVDNPNIEVILQTIYGPSN